MKVLSNTQLNNREDILDRLSNSKLFSTYENVATRVRTKLRAAHTTALSMSTSYRFYILILFIFVAMGLSKKDTLDIVRTFLIESGNERTVFII